MTENNVSEPQVFLGFAVGEWSVIRAALYELPAKVSVAVIGKLEQQLQRALEAKPVRAEEDTK